MPFDTIYHRRNKSLQRLSSIVFLAVALLLSSGSVQAGKTNNDEPDQELRGVWITETNSHLMFDRKRLASAMDYLADNGFNVVFPVVWFQQYTLHPSDVMAEYFGEDKRQSPAYAGQNLDPLEDIISEAKRVGIEVIPWFEYGFAAYNEVFANRDFIIETYPEWASKNREGEIAQDGSGFSWMNGFKPEVQDFMLELIEEVIENYDIDGIQGDDRLPAMPIEAGYSDYTADRYRDEHDGEDPPSNENSNAFVQWRADILSDFGGDLYEMVKDHDENLIVSLSPSVYNFSKNNFLQDWPEWLEREQVDIIHPQVYRRDLSAYTSTLDQQLNQFDEDNQHKFTPGVLSGLRSDDVVTPDTLALKVEANRERGVAGEVFFFYETIHEMNNNAADTLREKVYQNEAWLPHRDGELWRDEGTVAKHTDDQTEIEGDWETTDEYDGYRNDPLRVDGGSEASITWNVDVPYNAWFDVYAHIPYLSRGTDATTAAPFRVSDSDGEITEVDIDQTTRASRAWVRLGEVFLEEGSHSVVSLDASETDSTSPIYADAVMVAINRKLSPEVNVITHSPDDPVAAERPERVELKQNYPNPFNPVTAIEFAIPEPMPVEVTIYDIMGRKVQTLVDQSQMEAGSHQLEFDATGLASGKYIYRLYTPEGTNSQIMTLVK